MLICFAFLAGCEESIEPKFTDDSKIAVTAELIAGQPPVIHIVELNSIGKTGPPKTIEDAEVIIQDLQTKEIFSFLPLSNGYWKNERFQAQFGKAYQLNIKSKNQEVNALCTIPLSFTANAELNDNNRSTIRLNLPETNVPALIIALESRSYRMEGNSIVYLDDWKYITMECEDPATDNIRYGELSAPYFKLFVPAKATARQLNFTPEYQNGMRKFRIHIKSVEPTYYKYVYDYEYLKKNNFDGANSFIGLQSNINNGLGIFAGVYEKVIELAK
ncbi:DUF4249 family protein [Pedobacter caeni]|uniref:DUF4249 family protein n=1 Tax=Pedobacter caeni TaxID=288992 RepID=UPI001356467E|nr:DUF4249 family protein [Pedobacter caeni]